MGFGFFFLLIMKKIPSRNVKDFCFLHFDASPSWKWRISSQRWTIYKCHGFTSAFWTFTVKNKQENYLGLECLSWLCTESAPATLPQSNTWVTQCSYTENLLNWKGPTSSLALEWIAWFIGVESLRWEFEIVFFNMGWLMQNDTCLRSEACQESHWFHHLD